MAHPPAPAPLAPSPGTGADVGRLARGVLALLLVPSLYVLWHSAALPALSTPAARLGPGSAATGCPRGSAGAAACSHPSAAATRPDCRAGAAVRRPGARPPAADGPTGALASGHALCRPAGDPGRHGERGSS